jgi:hypothetical protein
MNKHALYVADTRPDSFPGVICNSWPTLVNWRGCCYDHGSLVSTPMLRGSAGIHRNCIPALHFPLTHYPNSTPIHTGGATGEFAADWWSLVYIYTNRAGACRITNWERAALAPSTRPGDECALEAGRFLPRIGICNNQQVRDIAFIVITKCLDNFRIKGADCAAIPCGNSLATYSRFSGYLTQGNTPLFSPFFLRVQVSNSIPDWHNCPPFDRSYVNRIPLLLKTVNIGSNLYVPLDRLNGVCFNRANEREHQQHGARTS